MCLKGKHYLYRRGETITPKYSFSKKKILKIPVLTTIFRVIVCVLPYLVEQIPKSYHFQRNYGPLSLKYSSIRWMIFSSVLVVVGIKIKATYSVEFASCTCHCKVWQAIDTLNKS